MVFAAFVVRFIGYALVMALTSALASYFWSRNGLDDVAAVAAWRSLGTTTLQVAPLLLALLGIVARPLAIFLLCYLIGAALTAPFVLARFVH